MNLRLPPCPSPAGRLWNHRMTITDQPQTSSGPDLTLTSASSNTGREPGSQLHLDETGESQGRVAVVEQLPRPGCSRAAGIFRSRRGIESIRQPLAPSTTFSSFSPHRFSNKSCFSGFSTPRPHFNHSSVPAITVPSVLFSTPTTTQNLPIQRPFESRRHARA